MEGNQGHQGVQRVHKMKWTDGGVELKAILQAKRSCALDVEEDDTGSRGGRKS